MKPLSAVALVIALVSSALAQPNNPAPDRDRPGVTPLLMSALPAPTPALRYELLPRPKDRRPGNAAVGYLRAMLARPPAPPEKEKQREETERVEKWREAGADAFPVGEVRAYLQRYNDLFRHADAAARMDHCDWQHAPIRSPGEFGRLLDEAQHAREIAAWLQLRCRLAVAEGRYDDAVRTLQTGFRLGKHVGEGRSVIDLLVGHAVTAVMLGEAERLAARPDGPNLYWAIAALPAPLVDPRPALDGEQGFVAGFLPGLKELEAGPVGEEQAQRTLAAAVRTLTQANDPAETKSAGFGGLLEGLGVNAFVALHGPAAKKQLIALGRPAKEVEAMPNAQAVLLRSVAVQRELWDDHAKLFLLRPADAYDQWPAVRRKLDAAKAANAGDPLFAVFSTVFPAVDKVHEAHARVQRRAAQFRAVEAVRLHAAAHAGRPPASLAEVKIVPVPDDPGTGKPFVYTAGGGTFAVTFPPPAGEPSRPWANTHTYEVRLRGK